jgi:hypothetical protein
MIHPNQWVLTSLDRDGSYRFWERAIPTEQRARDLFNELCRHARVHGGRYRLRSPDGAVETFSASAENE